MGQNRAFFFFFFFFRIVFMFFHIPPLFPSSLEKPCEGVKACCALLLGVQGELGARVGCGTALAASRESLCLWEASLEGYHLTSGQVTL